MPAIRRLLILILVIGLHGTLSLGAAELVSQQEMRSALRAAASQRSTDIETIDAVLVSPAVREEAKRLGANVNDLRTALPTLNDAELRDLAARAEALKSDPTAGLSSDANDLLVIFLIVAIVILVLKAVD
jgi:hypothetical protein